MMNDGGGGGDGQPDTAGSGGRAAADAIVPPCRRANANDDQNSTYGKRRYVTHCQPRRLPRLPRLVLERTYDRQPPPSGRRNRHVPRGMRTFSGLHRK